MFFDMTCITNICCHPNQSWRKITVTRTKFVNTENLAANYNICCNWPCRSWKWRLMKAYARTSYIAYIWYIRTVTIKVLTPFYSACCQVKSIRLPVQHAGFLCYISFLLDNEKLLPADGAEEQALDQLKKYLSHPSIAYGLFLLGVGKFILPVTFFITKLRSFSACCIASVVAMHTA